MDAWQADPIRSTDRSLASDVASFGPAGLSLRLAALRRAIERAHPVSLAVDLGDREAADGLSPALTHTIHALLLEAAFSAARHAGAALVRLGVHLTQNTVLLRIEDDGAGFPFKGVYDLDALRAYGVGPQALAQRVASLGGAMSLDTSRLGTRIEITLSRSGGAVAEPVPAAAQPLLAAG